MCGDLERVDLFQEECIVDSKDSLAESLFEVILGLSGIVQLAPCDAYLADTELFSKIDGVPTDDVGERQPLLAKFDASTKLKSSKKISEMFENIPSCEGGIKARNINTPSELREIQSFLR
jgi:hypothetical protein